MASKPRGTMSEENDSKEEIAISRHSAGVYAFFEDVVESGYDYTLSVSAQGKTVEVPIPESTYRLLEDSFDDLER